MQALENIQQETQGGPTLAAAIDGDPIPPQKRRHVAVFEASKALMAYITPGSDEIGKVGPHRSLPLHALAFRLRLSILHVLDAGIFKGLEALHHLAF